MEIITNMICSQSQTKSLLEIAEEMDRKQQEKTASASSKKTKVASKVVKEPKAKVASKVIEEPKAKVEETVVEEPKAKVEEAVTASANKPSFVKIAKLTDKDRDYLNKYFRKYYPADYVDALLATY